MGQTEFKLYSPTTSMPTGYTMKATMASGMCTACSPGAQAAQEDPFVKANFEKPSFLPLYRFQGLKPGAFKLMGQLDSACRAPTL